LDEERLVFRSRWNGALLLAALSIVVVAPPSGADSDTHVTARFFGGSESDVNTSQTGRRRQRRSKGRPQRIRFRCASISRATRFRRHLIQSFSRPIARSSNWRCGPKSSAT
jgi:hypothetical protein